MAPGCQPVRIDPWLRCRLQAFGNRFIGQETGRLPWHRPSPHFVGFRIAESRLSNSSSHDAERGLERGVELAQNLCNARWACVLRCCRIKTSAFLASMRRRLNSRAGISMTFENTTQKQVSDLSELRSRAFLPRNTDAEAARPASSADAWFCQRLPWPRRAWFYRKPILISLRKAASQPRVFAETRHSAGEVRERIDK